MKKGFTLIELLVVVLIIGILAAIALPMYTKTVEKSRSAEGLLLGRNISTAIDRYLLENGYCDYDNCTLANLDTQMAFIYNENVRSGYTKYFGVVFPSSGYSGETGAAQLKTNLVQVIRTTYSSDCVNCDSLYELFFYGQIQPSDSKELAGKILCNNSTSTKWCEAIGAKSCTVKGQERLCIKE